MTQPTFDHLSISVSDIDRSAALYDAALARLGLVCLQRSARAATYGPPGFTGEAPFAIVVPREGAPPPPPSATHVAFRAPSRAAVDAFHAAALAHGAHDDGPPGLREHYHPSYYAAFVHDLDGNRLEAVVHT
jgi:catechol 2,3-dioxygenase-like lactoylglutathione lyase family enzyme